jgi:hypothetical protein
MVKRGFAGEEAVARGRDVRLSGVGQYFVLSSIEDDHTNADLVGTTLNPEGNDPPVHGCPGCDLVRQLRRMRTHAGEI